jgi:hypothetical protein
MKRSVRRRCRRSVRLPDCVARISEAKTLVKLDRVSSKTVRIENQRRSHYDPVSGLHPVIASLPRARPAAMRAENTFTNSPRESPMGSPRLPPTSVDSMLLWVAMCPRIVPGAEEPRRCRSISSGSGNPHAQPTLPSLCTTIKPILHSPGFRQSLNVFRISRLRLSDGHRTESLIRPIAHSACPATAGEPLRPC